MVHVLLLVARARISVMAQAMNVLKIGNPLLRKIATPFTPSEILSSGTRDVVLNMLAMIKEQKAVRQAMQF